MECIKRAVILRQKHFVLIPFLLKLGTWKTSNKCHNKKKKNTHPMLLFLTFLMTLSFDTMVFMAIVSWTLWWANMSISQYRRLISQKAIIEIKGTAFRRKITFHFGQNTLNGRENKAVVTWGLQHQFSTPSCFAPRHDLQFPVVSASVLKRYNDHLLSASSAHRSPTDSSYFWSLRNINMVHTR